MATESAAVGSENGAGKAAAGFSALKPQLVLSAQKADEAVKFYKAAFGAEELKRENHPKRKAEQEIPLILCAELKIGASSFLVCDQFDDSAEAVKDGGVSGIYFRLETEDVQGAVEKALKAGATLVGEIMEEEGPCGGALVGRVKDPFGVCWILASVTSKCTAGDAEARALI